MKSVIFALDERLGNPGDTLSLAGHLDESGYELGEHEFELPDGIDAPSFGMIVISLSPHSTFWT